MKIRGAFHFFVGLIAVAGAAWATPPLESLAQAQPYAPDHTWPVLTAAQWTGDPSLDAVIILSIDDMRDPAKYEAFLRPILDRLAAAGAPGALSIFTNSVDPADPQLQAWITEGLSIEAHTIKHPCPQLCQGNLDEAKKTYDDCVDLLAAIPNMRPVAARVPCCDSMNSASPRYFSEIFAGRTPGGRHLDIDSSVFCVFNPDDPALPIELLHDPQSARGRFEKYLPFPAFTTTIANYPYPYIIGKATWEFPCIVPSDWEAQHKNQPNAPETVEDMKAAIDATVIKQGTYTLCFHPHKWIEAAQVVSLIDHAQEKYGARVRFMSFATAERLLREQLLLGRPLRTAEGDETEPRLLDVNGDGYMDVFRGTGQNKYTSVWDAKERKWNDYRTNFDLSVNPTVKKTFASVEGCVVICRMEKHVIGWRFDDGWKKDKHLVKGLENVVGALRAVDIDHDGTDELIAGDSVLWWSTPGQRWDTCAFKLPVPLADAAGHDNGVRFVDLDEDRDYDLVYSNEAEYGVWLFDGFTKGWATEALRGARGSRPAGEELPPIVRAGRENGFWTAKRTAWWHNEYTDTLPDRVDRRTFAQLLAQVKPRAKDVAEAVGTMRSPGRDVVAVAAEPLVRDPVCIAWDARGRLWTAEMRDYPLGLNNDGTPGSEIRVLDDTDHDGIYDKATVFLEGLAFADGVLPWRNGALVTCAPQIFYAEDRDVDGKAEHREVLFEGFLEGNQQHRVNGLRWGGDGWIYAANGDSNGRIKSLKTGQVVDIRGRDLRFNPDTGAFETVTGNAQFGRSRDDFGRWFGCANWSPMWAYTFDEHYQDRNPFLSVPDPRDFFIDSDRVFPASVVTERFNDQHMAGFFTSACGVEVYRDTRLGPKPEDGVEVFTCEPVHNLVFRARGHFDEGGFSGGRVPEEQSSEFLASTDPWFRPVMVRTGPDGAIYVADMYRQIIEHPEYINEERQKELNLRAGEDEGRIWRVAPKGATLESIPDLTAKSSEELVALLRTPNGALRDLAQQQLFERADAAALPALKVLAEDAAAPAAARAAALWSLRMAGALEAATVAVALPAENAGLALEALRLSDEFLAGDTAVQEGVLTVTARAQATVPELRVQAAYTLGQWDDPRAGAALAPFFNGNDVLRVAALSSVNARNIGALWQPLLELAQREDSEDFDADEHEQVLEVAASLLLKVGEGNAALGQFAEAILGAGDEAWRWRAAGVLLDTVERFGDAFEEVFAPWPGVIAGRDARIEAARAAVGNAELAAESRALAARLLGRRDDARAADTAALAGLLDARNAPALIEAALRQLQRLGGPTVAQTLLAAWPTYPPSLQGDVAELLFSREEWTDALIAALEGGALSPRQLGVSTRQRLLTDDREGVHARVVKVLGAAASSDRQPVIDHFRASLTLAGDREHGKAIFAERCGVCHQLDGVGHRVGADLASLTDRRAEAILTSILDPNRAVETRYLSYEVETRDLLTLNGILSEESPTSLTLTGANGQQETVLRSEITAIRSTNRSIMPEGLEENLSPQDVADLIAFVAGKETGPKQFAGNAPAPVGPNGDGVLTCAAETAEIRGATLVYEEKTRNLGYWGSPDDHATWRLRDVKPGEYEVTMEYCCDNTQTGNTFRLTLGDNVLTGTVHGTGTWDVYRDTRVGTVRLDGKETTLNFGVEGDLNGYLIDLRSVTLTPKKN